MTAEIVSVVQGSALSAAIEAGNLAEQDHHAQHRALALELEQATYHATLAARRYEAVDPDNRLVAAELEARWNAALHRVAELEGRWTTPGRAAPRSVPVVDRDTLESLATDLPRVWEAPSSEMRLKRTWRASICTPMRGCWSTVCSASRGQIGRASCRERV